jgi:alpha-D-ribose 1-methylphosphonate 5-triphosphate synthase subunit PhnI
MYVAVKGGERAIENAHALLADVRRGDRAAPEISLAQIDNQLALGVDRVMCEGSLYDRELAALAIKQARGDLIEAIFLLRAYRTTLPRFGASEPVDTGESDVPEPATAETDATPFRSVADLLSDSGLIEREAARDAEPGDLTRDPLSFPAGRDLRLQNLARGDEGFLLALGYSTQRGYGRNHPFAGEIRYGEVEVEFFAEDAGFAVPLGTVALTEVQMVNQFTGGHSEAPRFTRGYGLVFGQSERKAMAMALVDRALRAGELGEETGAPAQDQEFVLSHSDNVQATGFVEHLKLPHYVDFQAELGLLRKLRAEYAERTAANDDTGDDTATPMQDAAE